jgi:hypothetical protein
MLRLRSAKNTPTAMNTNSGNSFPMVKKFTSHDACLMPRRFAQVSTASTARITSVRGVPSDSTGQ